ncbi:hypothetical protein [Pseudomonas putida]|uniref:Uncharacterized protein n=1 Tax=Pseudomonas putida TaxID=303 RepID=A0A2S3W793_PSEPU|nr:hypothetical protein [Pseudomonas putida]POF86528.1 hypothetical protein BGP80_00645 [Pseudomonas putida]
MQTGKSSQAKQLIVLRSDKEDYVIPGFSEAYQAAVAAKIMGRFCGVLLMIIGLIAVVVVFSTLAFAPSPSAHIWYGEKTLLMSIRPYVGVIGVLGGLCLVMGGRQHASASISEDAFLLDHYDFDWEGEADKVTVQLRHVNGDHFHITSKAS